MAVLVVDVLEPVEVHCDHPEAGPDPTRLRDHEVERGEGTAPVQELSQRVEEGVAFRLGLEPAERRKHGDQHHSGGDDGHGPAGVPAHAEPAARDIGQDEVAHGRQDGDRRPPLRACSVPGPPRSGEQGERHQRHDQSGGELGHPRGVEPDDEDRQLLCKCADQDHHRRSGERGHQRASDGQPQPEPGGCGRHEAHRPRSPRQPQQHREADVPDEIDVRCDRLRERKRRIPEERAGKRQRVPQHGRQRPHVGQGGDEEPRVAAIPEVTEQQVDRHEVEDRHGGNQARDEAHRLAELHVHERGRGGSQRDHERGGDDDGSPRRFHGAGDASCAAAVRARQPGEPSR